MGLTKELISSWSSTTLRAASACASRSCVSANSISRARTHESKSSFVFNPSMAVLYCSQHFSRSSPAKYIQSLPHCCETLTDYGRVLNVRYFAPPHALPCIPTMSPVHTPSEGGSDSLMKGFSRLARHLCKSDTCGIDRIVPEVCDEFNIFLIKPDP